MLDSEHSAFQVASVEVGDLKLAARGRLEPGRHGDDAAVVEIKARYGIVGARRSGLLHQAGRAAGLIEGHDAISLRIATPIWKHRWAMDPLPCIVQEGG